MHNSNSLDELLFEQAYEQANHDYCYCKLLNTARDYVVTSNQEFSKRGIDIPTYLIESTVSRLNWFIQFWAAQQAKQGINKGVSHV